MDNILINEIVEGLKKVAGILEIKGAVIFGSFARGEYTHDSDIDLLVVAEKVPPEFHRRYKEIYTIKEALRGKRIDIILMTENEVITNFRNHTPIFLDIAEEGITLIDEGNFLQGLISETKDYIIKRGIRRIKEGWEFPVEEGVPTFLSRMSNRDFASAMLKDGERDFIIGEKLLKEGFYDKSVYHFQQAIETCVKAILITTGAFQKSHFVGETLEKSILGGKIPGKWKGDLLKVAEISKSIEPAGTLSRYPGIINDKLWMPSEEFEEEDAEKAERDAHEAFDEWFEERKYG